MPDQAEITERMHTLEKAVHGGLGEGARNWSALNQRLQVPSKLLVFPEAGHWILRGEDSRYFYNEVHAWLAKYLK